MERKSRSTTFTQDQKSRFTIQKLKNRFNTRIQRKFRRKPHYALKRAKTHAPPRSRQESKNQNQTHAHESKQPHKSDEEATEPKPELFSCAILVPRDSARNSHSHNLNASSTQSLREAPKKENQHLAHDPLLLMILAILNRGIMTST
jgi:hypothetical protein